MSCSASVAIALASVLAWMPDKPAAMVSPPVICDIQDLYATSASVMEEDPFSRRRPLALWDHERKVIVVYSNFSGESAVESALLAHELEHYEQQLRGEMSGQKTRQQLEGAAVAMQRRYYDEHKDL